MPSAPTTRTVMSSNRMRLGLMTVTCPTNPSSTRCGTETQGGRNANSGFGTSAMNVMFSVMSYVSSMMMGVTVHVYDSGTVAISIVTIWGWLCGMTPTTSRTVSRPAAVTANS